MGLLDDLDQLISSSQKQKAASGSQKQPARGGKVGKQSSKEKEGAYSTWTLSQLQDEVKRYGFRPSNDRKSLLKQLKEVQEALERQRQEQDEDTSVAGDTSMMSSSSFVCPSSLDQYDEEVSMSDLTMEMIKQARETDIIVAAANSHSDEEASADDLDDDDDDEDDEDEDEELRLSNLSTSSATAIASSVSTQLYKAITSDKSLYHRILLFEPVSLDEVSSTAKRAGVTGLKNKDTLRSWLDMQGICFYSAELSGQRKRY